MKKTRQTADNILKIAHAGFTLLEVLLAVALISLTIDITLRVYTASNFSITNPRSHEMLNYMELLGQKMIGLTPAKFSALDGTENPFPDINKPKHIQKISISVQTVSYKGSSLNYYLAAVTLNMRNPPTPRTFYLYKQK